MRGDDLGNAGGGRWGRGGGGGGWWWWWGFKKSDLKLFKIA